jgi:hypothetical protein
MRGHPTRSERAGLQDNLGRTQRAVANRWCCFRNGLASSRRRRPWRSVPSVTEGSGQPRACSRRTCAAALRAPYQVEKPQNHRNFPRSIGWHRGFFAYRRGFVVSVRERKGSENRAKLAPCIRLQPMGRRLDSHSLTLRPHIPQDPICRSQAADKWCTCLARTSAFRKLGTRIHLDRRREARR